jgi:hypothetical protein
VKAVQWPRWMRWEQRLQGTVVLERGEPRRDAIQIALEKLGYHCVDEPPQAPAVGYRDAATPSLAMTFVRPGNPTSSDPKLPSAAVKSICVWRSDDRTMAYMMVLLPLWLLQAAGVAAAVLSITAVALGAHTEILAGLIVAGMLLGLPKLWIDDAHHVVREALGEVPAIDPLVAPPRRVEPAEPPEHEEVRQPERVRVATDPAGPSGVGEDPEPGVGRALRQRR